MNLRQTTSETADIQNQKRPGYKQSEKPKPQVQQILFELSDADRILTRAGALQETQYQQFSTEQQRVILPYSNQMLLRQTFVTVLACCLVIALSHSVSYKESNSSALISRICVFPLLIAFFTGTMGGSRFLSAISGVVLAVTAIVFCPFLDTTYNHTVTVEPFTLKIALPVLILSTLVTVAGAQTRRILFQRQTSKRVRAKRIADPV